MTWMLLLNYYSAESHGERLPHASTVGELRR